MSGRERARRLALVFGRTAETLEQSAVLADEHAQRCAQIGRLDGVAREREAAERARAGASRARLKAATQEELFHKLDELERRADERDQKADERQRLADERERHADERERHADERERAADAFEAQLGDGWGLGSSEAWKQSQEALRQAHETLERVQAKAMAARQAGKRQATRVRSLGND